MCIRMGFLQEEAEAFKWVQRLCNIQDAKSFVAATKCTLGPKSNSTTSSHPGLYNLLRLPHCPYKCPASQEVALCSNQAYSKPSRIADILQQDRQLQGTRWVSGASQCSSRSSQAKGFKLGKEVCTSQGHPACKLRNQELHLALSC